MKYSFASCRLCLIFFCQAFATPIVLAEEGLQMKVPDTENCIINAQITGTDIIDDNTIVFFLTGKRIYINRLPRRCPGLKAYGGFAYEPTGTRLCDVDTIRVLSATGLLSNIGPFCALGKFTRMDEQSLAELKARIAEESESH